MKDDKYNLENGEYIILLSKNVCLSNRGSYSDDLVLTNKNLIYAQYGIFNSIINLSKVPLNSIDRKQSGEPLAMISKANINSPSLDVYINGKNNQFYFPTHSDRLYKVWVIAIKDRFDERYVDNDYTYYQQFLENEFLSDEELDRKILKKEQLNKNDNKKDKLKKIASAVLSSNPDEIADAIETNVSNQTQTRGVLGTLMDDLGVTDIKNEFLDGFGIPRTKTIEEKREEMREEIADTNFNEMIEKRKNDEKIIKDSHQHESSIPLKEQLELLTKLKELKEANILTEEEFEIKKKEILK